MRRFGLVLAVVLCGCSGGPPLVDMTNVDPVVYQRDLDQCEATSQTADEAGPALAGAIMGATIGTGLGAIAAGPVLAESFPLDVGYGAAAGTAAGAGVSAATAKPLAVPPPAPLQTVAQCLAAHGYKVIAPSQ